MTARAMRKLIVVLVLALAGCATKPYNVYGICSDSCWLEDEADSAVRARSCLDCMNRLERERVICGGYIECQQEKGNG